MARGAGAYADAGASHVHGMSDGVEGGVAPVQFFPVAQIRCVVRMGTQMIHVLRPTQQLKEFYRPRRPAGDIPRQLLEHGCRTLAAAIADGVGHIGARRRYIRYHAVQGAVADEITDIGCHPRRAGFDELVVVELFEVFLHGCHLLANDGEQFAQRIALLRIADAVDGGQQFVETVGGRVHGISSR